jgi:putative CocE/NonD family hydrolase
MLRPILPFLGLALVAQAPAPPPAQAAQPSPQAAGSWGGAVKLPGDRSLNFTVVITGGPGSWGGTFSVPDQGMMNSPISDVSVEGRKVAFKVAAVPGGLVVEGTLSEDGKTLAGTASQAGNAMPYTLERGRAIAAAPNPIEQRYIKKEVMIPMRDGVKLFTSIYIPKDASKPRPILLQRTPYSVGPYGADKFRRGVGPSVLFQDEGYIVAYQDVRGRYMSEGAFDECRPINPGRGPKEIDETTDTWDTVDWLVKNLEANNGHVGMWGISYPGHYAAQALSGAHPALKAVSPQAPMMDLWVGDDSYHNGAFQLAATFSFFTFFSSNRDKPSADNPKPIQIGTRDGYRWFLDQGPIGNLDKVLKGREPIWRAMVEHDTYDAYWKARDLGPHMKDVKPAVLTVGGWFDAEDLYGPLALYRSLEKQSAATDQHLVMGPWTHGQWASGDGSRIGNATFGSKTSAWYQKEVELKFFTQHLKGAAGATPIPRATVFATGANEWKSFDAWPPKTARPRSLYFHADGRLGFEKPAAAKGFAEYVADPMKPVPYTQEITFGYTRDYMTEDQRFAATRPDVLVFQTEPLAEDVTLAGPVKPELFVSTTGTDADWVVKLIDVQPDDTKNPENSPKGWHAGGYQMLVRGDVLRGKFRDDFSKPKAYLPNTPTKTAFTIPDVFHTFKKGHRIMVQVQSSWFPLVDRNPQVFTQIPKAKASDFRKATHRLFTTADMPSRLDVLELK